MAYRDYSDYIIFCSLEKDVFHNCNLIEEWLISASIFHVGFHSLSAARRCVACLKDVQIVKWSKRFYIISNFHYGWFKHSCRLLSELVPLSPDYLDSHFYLYFPAIDDFARNFPEGNSPDIISFYPVTDLHNKEI